MKKVDLQRMRPVLAIAMVLGTGFIAARAWSVAGEISAHGGHEANPGSGHNTRLEKLTTAMNERQERRQAVRSLPRDPFRTPSAARIAPATDNAAPAATAVAYHPLPVVRGLIYDNVKPAVQLAVGEEVSRWLGKDEAFQGWIVLEINPASVRVSNGTKQHELGLK
jgi:hypothetical protein